MKLGRVTFDPKQPRLNRESSVSDIWYLADQDGNVGGPFTLQQLQQTLTTVPNSGDVLVWHDKFPDWRRAAEIPELSIKIAVPSSLPKQKLVAALHDKGLSTQTSKWRKFIAPLGFVRTVGSRFGRRQIRRFGLKWPISGELKRWSMEDPPDAAVVQHLGPWQMRRFSSERRLKRWDAETSPDVIAEVVRAAQANYLALLITLLSVAYGIYHGALLNSPLSGLIAGILCAGILILLISAARKYRVKNPTPLLIWIGKIAHWLGWALALYVTWLILYRAAHLGFVGGMRAFGNLLPSVVFYLALGRGIRYMLGR